jgi:DNA-binding transcriptional ArsR family regulator
VARQLKLSVPAASQYLRALEARGLLTYRRVGLRVEYRLSAAATSSAAAEIVTGLRFALSRRAQHIDTLFHLATAFTHPRRIEIFRAVKDGVDSFRKLQAATHISARALSRHLTKLEARGFVKNQLRRYAVENPRYPFGRILARLAGKKEAEPYFAKYASTPGREKPGSSG